MPTPGLSLVGFMADQQQALKHLRMQCVPADPSDAALLKEWEAAKKGRGSSMPNAGKPEVLPIPPADNPYIQQLLQQSWVRAAFQRFGYANIDFKLVEIDPLLAYRCIVDTARSQHHCGGLKDPTIAELLLICLPTKQPRPQDMDPVVDQAQSQSTIIKVRNLDVQPLDDRVNVFGLNNNGYETWFVGVQLHVTLPFVHVVQFNRRFYLVNGYHRAFGIRRSGATHVPCLLRNVATPQAAGIMESGQTFPLHLMESADPPTIGHFTQGRAHSVQLRELSRILQVTFSQSVLPDEYEAMGV